MATTDQDLNAALLVGTAAGLRPFTPLGVAAVRGDIGSGSTAQKLPLIALGELLTDKLPFAPARTIVPSLVARALVGGVVGGGRKGSAQAGVAGAAVAVVAAYGGQHTRKLIGRVTGLPDAKVALAEDALAIALAYLGTRPRPA